MTGSSISERLLANPYGITEVHRSENPVVDIVFVHGLNGSPFSTWATKDTKFFWPAELLPQTIDLPIRVLMFGYNATVAAFMDGASRDKLHNHAENLAAHLYAHRSPPTNNDPKRPIIFVCHSLGGLVVKKALTHCSHLSGGKLDHLRSIFVSTYGILFLGTPHNGSDMAKLGSRIQSLSRAVIPKILLDSSGQLLNVLEPDNEVLQNVNRDFANIMKRFNIYFFHETEPMDIKGSRILIVDETSAAPILDGVERLGIEADHGAMCRFKDQNAPGYMAVKEAIFRYSSEALKEIPLRWREERDQQIFQLKLEKQRLDDLMHTPKPDHAQNPTPEAKVNNHEHIEPKEPFFVLPPGFHPNSAFYGMQEELEQLHSRLFKSKKRSQGSVAVLLYAGPGAGKTYLARQYMYQYQRLYPGGIFWVDSKTPQSRADGYWNISQAAYELEEEKQSPDPSWLSHDTYVDKVRRWLESRDDWLLIFDGIAFDDDKEITEFKQYLPFRPNTSIIYTSVDRTLSKKSRLFEPYGLKVKPLAVEDAKKLLFKELEIKRPTPVQDEKATQLVKHYDRLPLAIHAISRRLVASGKALEKYDIESHLTDQHLAGPYQGIMNDLRSHGHNEALNLINILSFFSHHTPVGMILLGRKALVDARLEIRSLDREGSSERHIDKTLAILIRYGLIERILDSDSLSDRNSNLSIARTSSGHSATSPGSEKFVFISPARSSIEMIKVHTVVQGFCRDELKVQSLTYYYQWLAVAAGLFCRSYTEADARIKATRDPGHVRDYREYHIHAKRLIQHFPRKLPKGTIDLKPIKQRLLDLTKEIEKEVASRSPSSSQESVRNQKSIFDTASSMSTEPSTPASDLSQTAWSIDLASESPEQVLFPPMPEIKPQLADAQLSDQQTGSHGPASPALTNLTLTPSMNEASQTGKLDNQEEGEWHKVPERRKVPERGRSSRLWDSFRDRIPWSARSTRGRGRKNLGEFRPAAPVLSNVHGTGAPIPPKEPAQRQSIASLHSQSPAESMLANIGHSSPPSRGGSVRAQSRTRTTVDDRPTYATVARNQPTENAPERQPSPLSSGPPFPGLNISQTGLNHNPLAHPAMEFHPDPMTQSAYSDPGLGPPSFQSPSSDPASRYSRFNQPNWPPRVPAANFTPLPYQADILITRRAPANIPTLPHGGHVQGLAPPAHPNMQLLPLPYGYGSQPLSHNPSQQSTYSLHTEPSRRLPRSSPDPRSSDPSLHQRTSSLTSRVDGFGIPDPLSAQQLWMDQGSSAVSSDIDSPIVGAQSMSRGSSGPGIRGPDGTVVEFGAPLSNGREDIQFGEQDPIKVADARWRTEQYERWLAQSQRRRGRAPYPHHNLIPTSGDTGQLESLLNRTATTDKPYPNRARSGSSPTRPTFHRSRLQNN